MSVKMFFCIFINLFFTFVNNITVFFSLICYNINRDFVFRRGIKMIDYDSLLKKIPKVKKYLDDGQNSILYHYTKPEKLLSILESGIIRFSNALYLNDKEEVTYSYKLIVELIDDMPELNQKLFEKVREHFDSKYKNIINGEDNFNYKYEYYTISFSVDGDNLMLWNNYSKGQTYTGYNIGFCKKDLIADMEKQGFHSVYGNIIYTRTTQIEVLKQIFEKWNRQFEKLEKAKKTQKNSDKELDVLFELIDILSIISLFFKNPHFKDEKEYRIIFINNFKISSFKQTKIFEKNGLFIPYIEYKFLKKNVSCINIGPTLNENIFYTSTCRMLSNFGYGNKTINRSKIPLRF